MSRNHRGMKSRWCMGEEVQFSKVRFLGLSSLFWRAECRKTLVFLHLEENDFFYTGFLKVIWFQVLAGTTSKHIGTSFPWTSANIDCWGGQYRSLNILRDFSENGLFELDAVELRQPLRKHSTMDSRHREPSPNLYTSLNVVYMIFTCCWVMILTLKWAHKAPFEVSDGPNLKGFQLPITPRSDTCKKLLQIY